MNVRECESLWLYDVDLFAQIVPLYCILKSFRVNVCRHQRSGYVSHLNVVFFALFVQPRNGYSVSPAEMSHCWVSSRSYHCRHGLVVHMKVEDCSRVSP